ncbi:DUF2442 domain-containing protein [Thiomicrospira microaerophila]|uniref:DUF2442 domain-containing protein n=1 Tax=Thiomicrospira microaerophila TaxID=406020 RepID=UPI0005C9DF88|nr:DUF2442 domain-containing protein [Thiomicrospira microaerophila]
MFLHVVEAEAINGFKIKITFNDGREGTADLADALNGSVFEPLKDPFIFSSLKVDPELETVVWPNGADLAPEFLYFQAFKQDPELQDQFKQWGYV